MKTRKNITNFHVYWLYKKICYIVELMLSLQTNCSYNPRQFILNISKRQEYDLLANIHHHNNQQSGLAGLFFIRGPDLPLILPFSRQNRQVQTEE